MVKTFKNLLLQNRGCLGAESLHEWSGMVGLPNLLKELFVRWRLTFFTARSNLLPYAFVWEKTFKNLLLRNRGCLEAESLHEWSGMGGLPNLLKELSYVDIWPFYGKVKFASLCIRMGKTFKNLPLQNGECLVAESLHISSGTGGLPKLLK